MTKIIDLEKHRKKPRLQVVNKEEKEKDKLYLAMSSAMYSMRCAKNWEEHRTSHLLNLRDALDRASFLLDDELAEHLGHDREDND